MVQYDPGSVEYWRKSIKHLTKREQEVLSCIEKGLSHRETATKLGNSPKTVRMQVRSILSKFAIVCQPGEHGTPVLKKLLGYPNNGKSD